MIDNIIKIYKVGKELGLTKREVSSLFFSKNPRRGRLFMLLFVLLIILITTVSAILIVFSFIQIARDTTYPTGTRYSTVKIKDFRLKGNKT